ncbi:MAG: hypothetical protein PHT03_07330 [Bacilli bacterium]|nr:hypothetical protein [Bacilli bacterium]
MKKMKEFCKWFAFSLPMTIFAAFIDGSLRYDYGKFWYWIALIIFSILMTLFTVKIFSQKK